MPATNPEIQIVADADALYQAAAAEFVRQVRAAAETKGACTVALSGGSTPKGLYGLLADDPTWRGQVPWDNMHVFWGDERHVPPDHPDSNYRMAHEALLSKVPIPPAHVHRIKSEHPDARQAADDYEQELRAFFHISTGQLPRFDLIFLGLGPEGHTASLFPGTKALHETRRLVVSTWVGKFFTERITLTPPVLSHAAGVIFLVSGDDKALALKAVLEGNYEPEQLPAQLIRPAQGRVLWLVDRAAASLLQAGQIRMPTSGGEDHPPRLHPNEGEVQP
jgi:6-phosphogluconolactonase